MSQYDKEIGERIREKRNSLDLSQEELAKKIGYTYRSTVSKMELGETVFKPSMLVKLADALQTTPSWLAGWDQDNNVIPEPIQTTVKIPVFGSVPAGVPVEAIEDIDGYLELPSEWLDHGDYIALRVSGSSMYPKYIDGDRIVVRLQSEAPSGSDAVVYVNGYDATLKTIRHEADGSVSLIPKNPEYETKNYPENLIRILGVVKRLERDI